MRDKRIHEILNRCKSLGFTLLLGIIFIVFPFPDMVLRGGVYKHSNEILPKVGH